ncbi:MAG: arginase family protein [Chloroflexota bacterium]
MTRKIGLLGVPSSAGAKTPGIEKAPHALRKAGLFEQFQQAGYHVVDHGDLPRIRYAPDKAHPTAQNLERVVAVATDVAKQVGAILDAGEIPLIIGGDCSITVGVAAAFVQHDPAVLLVYIDGGIDLETPATNSEGNLDSMGVAHLIGETGVTEVLSHIGTRFPLLLPEQMIFFGFEPMPPDDAEQIVLAKYAMQNYPVETVRGRAKLAAVEVLATIEAQHKPFIIHFDVDVIDFVDFPIADVPMFNQGLTFAEAMDSLAVFAASPQFAGLVITEINPDHMDEDGAGLQRFVLELVRALQPLA